MNLKNKTLHYQTDADKLIGYLAWDESQSAPMPGVIVIHEWWGLNDYMHVRANRIAELGYCAFAIDMFADGKTADVPDEANKLKVGIYNDMQTGSARLRAAYDALLQQPQVDSARTAAMGFCFGGAMALHMARMGMPLKAAVAFHAALNPFVQAEPGGIKPKILVCHGEADEMVSMDDVAAFKKEMDAARADYEVIVYPNARHGFTNPSADEKREKFGAPLGYDENAATKSWKAMADLFAEVF